MSARSDVLLWAQRVLALKAGPSHLLLDIRENATLDDAQAAFHKIARTAHPDLHRSGLSAAELELVTSAYATVAGAYQMFRSLAARTEHSAAVGPAGGAVPVTPSGPAPAASGAPSQMSSKALVYYRKAELALRRGDLKGATLQIKMAIAADPQSAFLRSALGEVEAELRKGS